jgi:hypothetical protein
MQAEGQYALSRRFFCETKSSLASIQIRTSTYVFSIADITGLISKQIINRGLDSR